MYRGKEKGGKGCFAVNGSVNQSSVSGDHHYEREEGERKKSRRHKAGGGERESGRQKAE